MALTDTFIRQTKHSGRAAGDKHSDGGGLYLHVSRAGKYWRLAYRFVGKQKVLAIGVYPAVTLAQARQRRDEAKTLLAQGLDPSAAKRAAKAERAAAAVNTVEAVGRAYLAFKKDDWSGSHYTRESRNLISDVFPYLGDRAIGDVEPPELLRLCRKIEERGTDARRMLLTARGVWQFAIAEGHATRDITQDISKALKKRIKGHHPAITNPENLGQLLRAIDVYGGGPVVRAALAIAPVLFQRPGNLRMMRWANLDLEAGLWTIPAADMKASVQGKKTGPTHLVPLPRQAIKIIEALRPLTGHLEYVFPGQRIAERPLSENAVGAALNALGYRGVQSWHGFRSTGRTIIREVFKVDPDILEAQLAHTGGKSHGGAYDRATFVDERAGVLQQWADYLDKLRIGADVVPLRPAA